MTIHQKYIIYVQKMEWNTKRYPIYDIYSFFLTNVHTIVHTNGSISPPDTP